MGEIPGRVTPESDGSYIWSAEVDMNVMREGYRTGGRICKGTTFVIFLFGVFFSIYSRSWKLFLLISASCLFVFLLTIAVVLGQENLGQIRRTYHLRDTLISTRQRKGSSVFEFSKAKKMMIAKNAIELRGKSLAFRAYIPEEDLEFVKDYIQARIPDGCEIVYEQDS